MVDAVKTTLGPAVRGKQIVLAVRLLLLHGVSERRFEHSEKPCDLSYRENADTVTIVMFAIDKA